MPVSSSKFSAYGSPKRIVSRRSLSAWSRRRTVLMLLQGRVVIYAHRIVLGAGTAELRVDLREVIEHLLVQVADLLLHIGSSADFAAEAEPREIVHGRSWRAVHDVCLRELARRVDRAFVAVNLAHPLVMVRETSHVFEAHHALAIAGNRRLCNVHFT